MTLQQDMSQGSSEMIGVSLGDQEFMELSYWEGWEEPTDTAWSDTRTDSTGINGFKNEEEEARKSKIRRVNDESKVKC